MTDVDHRKRALASLAAFLRVIDDLDKRPILWDGEGQSLVEDIYHRSQRMLAELVRSDQVTFREVPLRPRITSTPAGQRTLLRALLRDVVFALDVAVHAGLLDPANLPDLTPPPVKTGGGVSKHLRKIVIGVAIAVLGSLIAYAFNLK